MKTNIIISAAILLISFSFVSCKKEDSRCRGTRGGISTPTTYWFWTYYSGGNITIRVYDEDGDLVTSGFQTEKVLGIYYSTGNGPSSCQNIDRDNVSFPLQAGKKKYKWYAESGSKSWSGSITTDCSDGGCELVQIK